MLEQVGNPITFYVQFLDNTTRGPLSGITPGLTFWKFNKLTGTAAQQTVLAAPAELGTSGVYYVTWPGITVDVEGDYVVVFTAGSAALQRSIPVVCQVERGVKLLGTWPMAELGGVPTPTPTLQQAIMLLYMALRNQNITDSAMKLHNDAGTQIAQATLTDTGTTFTRTKLT